MTNKHAKALGRMGGKARAEKLSPERRAEIARKASEAARKARAALAPEDRSELARKAVAARWAKARARAERKAKASEPAD